MVKKLHGGTNIPYGTLRGKGGPKPRLYSHHAGSNLQQGQLHEAPTLPQVNSANYAGQRVSTPKGKRK